MEYCFGPRSTSPALITIALLSGLEVILTAKANKTSGGDSPNAGERLQVEDKPKSKSHISKIAGVLALIAGPVLIASGVTSGSILITVLDFVHKRFGSSVSSGDLLVLNFAIAALTFLVGLGGLLVIIGGILLLRRHGFSARLLIGLGGGMAILSLIFSMGAALFTSGFSSEIFHQSYFTLYWVGALLATAAIVLSRKA